MKRIISKRAISLVLACVMITASSIFLNVSAATTTNKYAYSIGCNHGFWAWLGGDHVGDFTDNVNYAADCYGMISDISGSYKSTQPTYTYMRGNNPNGTRRIASDIVFLNGHANNECLIHNHNNNDGDYATGIYIGNDYNSSSGYKYAGLNSTNMSTCDHISLVGCDTAGDGNNNITWKAVNRGATSALGFTDEITSRSSSGEGWLQKYNSALACGYTIANSLVFASAYYSSDLGTYAKIYGSSSNTVASSKSSGSSPFKTITTKIPCNEIENVVGSAINAENKMMSSIKAAISKMDSKFDFKNYKMTVNMFAPQDGNGMIVFTYYMEDTIKTNREYIAVIENNVIVEVLSNAVATKEQTGELNTEKTSEANLIAIAKAHSATNTLEIDPTQNAVKTSESYFYDYEQAELRYISTVFYKNDEADGVIVDCTKEKVLNR